MAEPGRCWLRSRVLAEEGHGVVYVLDQVVGQVAGQALPHHDAQTAMSVALSGMV